MTEGGSVKTEAKPTPHSPPPPTGPLLRDCGHFRRKPPTSPIVLPFPKQGHSHLCAEVR